MNRKFFVFVFTTLIVSDVALAHHSHGNYQIGQEIQIRGKVTKAHIANPHVWLFITVKNEAGEMEEWALESGSVNSFKRTGWSDIGPGDDLTVTCAPTRNGENGCFIADIKINAVSVASGDTSGWTNMRFPDQRFSANFPAEPEISEAPYLSEYGGTFPSTIYKARDDDGSYSVTVVDYSDAKGVYERLADEINVAGAHNFWLYDQMAAIAYAAQLFRLRGGEITYDAWHHVDFIGGHQLFIDNQDDTRTYAGIYRHANRLYILEATVAADVPPQGLFQQSLTILDDAGERVRYDLQPDHSRVRVDTN